MLAYSDKTPNFLGFNHKYNVASCDFAPWGEFGKAEEGFVYNIPVSKFEYKIQCEDSYFDTNLKMPTGLDFAKNLIFEILDENILDIIRTSERVTTSKIVKRNSQYKPDIIRDRLKVLNEKKLIKKVGPSYNWHWEIINK